jgi:Cytidylate kinase-like family
MSVESELEDLGLCRAYLVSQMENQQRASAQARWPEPGPAITIASQTGAGAHAIARQLAGILAKTGSGGKAAWTVFDRQLLEKVLDEHRLPKDLAKFMPEDRRSFIRDVMDELLGLRPPSWVMVPRVAETILHLADAGHVILVGRGANFITARVPNVFHVRLIASLPRRIERVQKSSGLGPEEAGKFIARTDRGIGRYAKTHFHRRVEDDLLYHLVINTDRIPCPAASQLIADAARKCLKSFSTISSSWQSGT